MSLFRVHKTANFTVMSNHHFKEKEMSLKAKGLLSLMLSLPDSWNYSIVGLVKLSKDGKDGVMSALAELEKFGYLQRERTTNEKGQFNGIEYNIYEEPQQQKPIEEKPILAKRHLVKANADKPQQLNTNQLNNLKDKELNVLNTQSKALAAVLAVNVPNEELKELYKDYVEMRQSIAAPITAKGLKKLIERAERLSNYNVKVHKLLLETAIINNWKSVYLPKEEELSQLSKETIKELKNFYFIED